MRRATIQPGRLCLVPVVLAGVFPLAGGIAAPDRAAARTLLVAQDGGGEFTRIQDAIQVANHGDVVSVAPGHYLERILFGGRRIQVRSTDGPARTTIDAAGSGSVVTMSFGESGETLLEGFTLTGGTGTHISLADAEAAGSPELQARRHRAGEPLLLSQVPPAASLATTSPEGRSQLAFGGAVLLLSASPVLRNLIIEGNDANVGGGLYAWSTLPTVERCLFRDNSAGLGAHVALDPNTNIRMSDCRFEGGVSASGGAIWLQFARFELRDSWIEANSGGEGGAIYSIGGTTAALLDHCVLRANRAGYGSAVFLRDSRIRLSRCTLVDNEFDLEDQGAIYLVENSTAELNRCAFSGNGLNPTFCQDSSVSATCSVFWPLAPSCASGSDNRVADPLFCNQHQGNFRLRSESPCRSENAPGDCGTIGWSAILCGAPADELDPGKERTEGRRQP
ncbi:MAG: hypothetical protein IPK72_09900 [Candidatus Eisenbacteria bacterium]|nr:hypothetical protein [Candidatus Eisenbacteria bacterium]